MRILLVEDEYSLTELISSRLKKEKYIVDVSLDGEDGLYNALMDIYDLIILDIMLPKVDGIQILKEIKKNNIILLFSIWSIIPNLISAKRAANIIRIMAPIGRSRVILWSACIGLLP